MKKNNIADLMIVDGNIEKAVKEYCKSCGFNLVSYTEYGERYIQDGTEYAQVSILMD